MKIIFFRFILTRFTPILCFFAWNCGILGCFCNFLVINYTIMGKKQYYERLLSPWCIKHFFHKLFSFFHSFFALFRPKQRPRMGMKILFTSKIKIFLISQQYFLSYWTWFEPFSPNTFDWKIIKDFGVQWTPYGLIRDYLTRAE